MRRYLYILLTLGCATAVWAAAVGYFDSIGIGTLSPLGPIHVYKADPVAYIQDTETTATSAAAYWKWCESAGGDATQVCWRLGMTGQDFTLAHTTNDNNGAGSYTQAAMFDLLTGFFHLGTESEPREANHVDGTILSDVAVSKPTRKVFSPVVFGTADTLFIWEGYVRGIADNSFVQIASGLDSTLTGWALDLKVEHRAASHRLYSVRHGVNFATAVVSVDTSSLSAGIFTTINGACNGTSGTDAKINICTTTVSGLGTYYVEHRLGGANVDITWKITAGEN